MATANCWSFWKCPQGVREKCPAYTTDSGRECWMLAGNFVEAGCPKLKHKFRNCLECGWFRRLNPGFFKEAAGKL